MDWNTIITDLGNSFDAERRADLVTQSIELAEAEHTFIEPVDRLRSLAGRLIRLRAHSDVLVDGMACRVEPSYVLVDEREGLQTVIPVGTVVAVTSLAGLAPWDDHRRPTLTALIREIVRHGTWVYLVLNSGGVVGRLVRVKADHVDTTIGLEDDIRSHCTSGVGGTGVVSVMTTMIRILHSR